MRLQESISQLIEAGQLIYLNKSDLQSLGVFDFRRACDQVEQAYLVHYVADTVMPKTEYLKYQGRPSYDRLIVLPGYLGGSFGLTGVKIIGSSTANWKRGFERASGLLVLIDPETQRPFAVLEGGQISAARTTAVTALAIKLFAPESVKKIALLGSGFLSELHLRMWSSLYREKEASIHVFDVRQEALTRTVNLSNSLGLDIRKADSAEAAIRDADLIIPATTAEQPYICAHWIKSGASYIAVSLQDPQLDVFTQASCIVVDDLELCKQEGRPLDLLAQQGLTDRLRIFTVGEVLHRQLKVRQHEFDRIIFNPMGTVITDLSLGVWLFEKALVDKKGVLLNA